MGKIIFLIRVLVISYFIVCIFILKGTKVTLKELCLISIIAAMSLILRSIRVPLPTGASIALLGVLPTMILALVYNHQVAIISGVLTAILSIMLVPGYAPIHPLQIFVEHIPALSVLGFAGIIGYDKKHKIIAGSVIAIVMNVVFHIFSGVLFFSQYAPEGVGAWAYSITYNLSSHGIEGVIAIIVISLLPIKYIRKIIGGNNNVVYKSISR